MDVKKTCNLFFLLMICFWGRSQDEVDATPSPQIFVKAFAKEDHIYLRWGVNEKWAWKYGNKYGYEVERTTIFRDGSPLEKSEKVLLTGKPIRPKPLVEWKTLVETNDMAAVAAQAIYGESFSVNDESDNLFLKVVNQSSELEQRFGFSMFAIDQDFTAAQYAGLGFIDKTVKPNERYLYNVKLAVPEELFHINESGILMASSEKLALPKPYDFAGYYYNNAFVLIWEYDGLLDFYTSYDLEKSEDGKNFYKVNDAPITKLAITKSSGISYTDSISEYNKKYWYRIKGKSLFDMMSPPSDTISVIAFKELLAAPQFGNNTILSEKKVQLRWEFPKDESWKLTGFEVLWAPKAIGPYRAIAEQLEKEEREFLYTDLKRINYFKIKARGIAGDYQESSPTMVQPVDSVPPAKPVGLQGTVDTLGVVRLTWQPNTEMDLKGYTVLRANRKNQEFTRLTKEELKKPVFQDTINIKNFSSKVYYQIIASDLRYNESQPSDTLILERPSRVPPTNPVFTEYEMLGDTILLKWATSSSEKLAKQIVYRKNLGLDDNQWENIMETEDLALTQFKDIETEPNTRYSYTITSVNTAGVESRPSPMLVVTTPKTLLNPKIKAFYAEVDRANKSIALSWRYNQPNVLELQLFKKENEGVYTLYKTFEPSINQFLDTKLLTNSNYGYGIKAVFTNGSTSEWIQIEIKY